MQENKRYRLILGSQSPRRKELLSHLKIPFEIVTADTSEESNQSDPILFAKEISKLKGEAVWEEVKGRESFSEEFFPFIISSDTIVVKDQKIYGKPATISEAEKTLKELSGTFHHVISSVTFTYLDRETKEKVSTSFAIKSKVYFSKISNDILKTYLKTGDSLDKAGSYGIQREGLLFVSKIEGSYSNVVGFPLSDVIEKLKITFGSEEGSNFNWSEYFWM